MASSASGSRQRSYDPWDWVALRATCLGLARRYARSADQADDITQEALLRAWRHRATLRDSNHLGPWLAQIVRHEAARYYGKRQPAPLPEVPDVEGGEDEGLLEVPNRADLKAAIGTLSCKERLLLRLRYDEDLTQEAIARLLDMPLGTVKVSLHRARGRLHRALEDP